MAREKPGPTGRSVPGEDRHDAEALDDGRVVRVGNETDKAATHPAMFACAARATEFFDLRNRADLQDILTFVDEAARSRQVQGPMRTGKQNGMLANIGVVGELLLLFQYLH